MDSAKDALAGDAAGLRHQHDGAGDARRTTRPASPRFADLDDGSVTYVVCVDDRALRQGRARRCSPTTTCTAKPASLEVDVKSVLAKVTSGEADAGFVYAHRRRRRGRPGRGRSRSRTPRTRSRRTRSRPLQQSEDADLAQQFVDLVLRAPGQQVLARRRLRHAVSDARTAAATLGRAARWSWWSRARSPPRCSSSRWSRWSLDTPWGSFVDAARHRRRSATRCGSPRWPPRVTVVACLLLGTPLAWLLARVDFPGRSAAARRGRRAAGAAAGRRRRRPGHRARAATALVGSLLRDATGLTIPYTTTAVVIAHTFVSMPFYVLSVEGALRASGERYDVVAATLGADRWTTFRRVTLPLALPGVLAGRGAGLGPLAGRVRRHHHLRRQLPRHHPDHAVADLPGAAVRPRGRPHAEHDPAGRLGRRSWPRCATAG